MKRCFMLVECTERFEGAGRTTTPSEINIDKMMGELLGGLLQLPVTSTVGADTIVSR